MAAHELPETPLTDEEIAELRRPESPKSGAEIAAMLESGELDVSAWSDVGDGAEWVERQRQKRKSLPHD